jgi:hypothetical protein
MLVFANNEFRPVARDKKIVLEMNSIHPVPQTRGFR